MTVEELYGHLIDAWNRRDADAFAGLFVLDGETIGFDGTQHTGRGAIAEQLQHASRARADVEERAVAVIAEHLDDRCFDRVVRGVQRAFLVPPRSDAGEVLVRRRSAPVTDDRQAVEVGGKDAVVLVGGRQHVADQFADGPVRHEIEERPCALPVFVDHARVGEQLEMTRDPRLRLAEDLGEVGDRELAVLQQSHDPQPGLFVEGPQHVEERVERQRHRRTI